MYGDQRPKKTSPFMVITLIAEQNFGSANKADRQPIPSHEGATSSERCLSGAEWPELVKIINQAPYGDDKCWPFSPLDFRLPIEASSLDPGPPYFPFQVGSYAPQAEYQVHLAVAEILQQGGQRDAS